MRCEFSENTASSHQRKRLLGSVVHIFKEHTPRNEKLRAALHWAVRDVRRSWNKTKMIRVSNRRCSWLSSPGQQSASGPTDCRVRGHWLVRLALTRTRRRASPPGFDVRLHWPAAADRVICPASWSELEAGWEAVGLGPALGTLRIERSGTKSRVKGMMTAQLCCVSRPRNL